MCGLSREWLVDREAPRPPGLSRPLHTFDVGWADQSGAVEMMFSPSCPTDSPPASPIRGTEAMRLLDPPDWVPVFDRREGGSPAFDPPPGRPRQVDPPQAHPPSSSPEAGR